MFFAIISAGGLGVGLVTLGPMLNMILTGTSLPELATDFDARNDWISIPAALIAVLPEKPFQGIVVLMAGILVLTVVGGFANFMHKYLSQALAATTVAQIRQKGKN